jgi:hypothetical protein
MNFTQITGDDENSAYSSVHTIQSSGQGGELRKETPVMKMKGTKKLTPLSQKTTSPPSRTAAASSRGADDVSEEDSDCSVFSNSVYTFTSFGQMTETSDQFATTKQDSEANVLETANENSSNSYSKTGRNFEMKRSSSLYSLGHKDGGKIEKLYTATSIHENLALHVRCGYAQRQNNRKYMEDCITVCPSFVANNMEALPSEEDDTNSSLKEDFSFFGVFDGHDGSYVSQYLREHLMVYFGEKLLHHLSPSSQPPSVTASPNSRKKKDLNMNPWRTSFLEAACKIDREILLLDAERLQELADQRQAAFDGTATKNGSEKVDSSSTGNSNGNNNDSFAGSTAAVVIAYRPHPPSQFGHGISSPSKSSSTAACSPGNHPCAKSPRKSPGVDILPPFPPHREDEVTKTKSEKEIAEEEEEENDNFYDDVVVGVFSKKDSAYVNVVQNTDTDSDASYGVSGPCPEPVRKPLVARGVKTMKRFSSIDSCYDAPAHELNLDDENVFDALESINNKQNMSFGKGMNGSKQKLLMKRDSGASYISDLTASHSHISLMSSSEELLHYQHSQPFNPKRQLRREFCGRFFCL